MRTRCNVICTGGWEDRDPGMVANERSARVPRYQASNSLLVEWSAADTDGGDDVIPKRASGLRIDLIRALDSGRFNPHVAPAVSTAPTKVCQPLAVRKRTATACQLLGS